MKKPSTSPISPLLSTRPAGAADRRAAGPGRRDVAPYAPGRRRAYPITGEEVAILRLMANGLPLNSVARHTGLSSRAIRRRLRGLCDRLGVTYPIQAIVWAARRGRV